MKVIDLFTDKVANIHISYGVERQRDIETKSKNKKKSKIKKKSKKKSKNKK
tara:strand:- start:546 stop:698 length:153 start_codon:yes stop_codon:yes gene_type:complete